MEPAQLTTNEVDVLLRCQRIDRGQGLHANVGTIAAAFGEHRKLSHSWTRHLLRRLQKKGRLVFRGISHAGTNTFLLPGHIAYEPEKLVQIDPLRTAQCSGQYVRNRKKDADLALELWNTARAESMLSAPSQLHCNGGHAIRYRDVYVSSQIHRNYCEAVWRSAVDDLLRTNPGQKGVHGITKMLLSICKRISAERKQKADEARKVLLREIAAREEAPSDVDPASAAANLFAMIRRNQDQADSRPKRSMEPAPLPIPNRYTVRDCLNAELALRALSCKPVTSASYSEQITRLVAEIGDVSLSEVDHDLVVRYCTKRKESTSGNRRPATMKTISREAKLLKAAIVNAYRKGWTTNDPSVYWPSIRSKVQPGSNWLRREDLKPLMTHLKPYQRDWVLWAVFTGGRRSELVGLNASDVDVEGGLVHIHASKSAKFDRKDRVLPLHRRLKAWMTKRNPTGPILTQYWRNSSRDLTLACQAAGLSYKLCLNDLRRTFATWLRKADVPSNEVAAMMGHSTPAMVDKHYARVDPGRHRDFIDKLL